MRAPRPLIGIDFDGTLADTGVFKREWAREHFGLHLSLDMCNRSEMLAGGLPQTDYNQMLLEACDRQHTMAAQPCPGAIDGVRQLAELAELCLVTDRGEFEDWLRWCELWIEENGLRPLLSRVFSTQFSLPSGAQTSKRIICSENSLAALIDDDPENLKELKDTAGILYSRDGGEVTSQQPGVFLARDWPEIVSVCRKLLSS